MNKTVRLQLPGKKRKEQPSRKTARAIPVQDFYPEPEHFVDVSFEPAIPQPEPILKRRRQEAAAYFAAAPQYEPPFTANPAASEPPATAEPPAAAAYYPPQQPLTPAEPNPYAAPPQPYYQAEPARQAPPPRTVNPTYSHDPYAPFSPYPTPASLLTYEDPAPQAPTAAAPTYTAPPAQQPQTYSPAFPSVEGAVPGPPRPPAAAGWQTAAGVPYPLAREESPFPSQPGWPIYEDAAPPVSRQEQIPAPSLRQPARQDQVAPAAVPPQVEWPVYGEPLPPAPQAARPAGYEPAIPQAAPENWAAPVYEQPYASPLALPTYEIPQPPAPREPQNDAPQVPSRPQTAWATPAYEEPSPTQAYEPQAPAAQWATPSYQAPPIPQPQTAPTAYEQPQAPATPPMAGAYEASPAPQPQTASAAYEQPQAPATPPMAGAYEASPASPAPQPQTAPPAYEQPQAPATPPMAGAYEASPASQSQVAPAAYEQPPAPATPPAAGAYGNGAPQTAPPQADWPEQEYNAFAQPARAEEIPAPAQAGQSANRTSAWAKKAVFAAFGEEPAAPPLAAQPPSTPLAAAPVEHVPEQPPLKIVRPVPKYRIVAITTKPEPPAPSGGAIVIPLEEVAQRQQAKAEAEARAKAEASTPPPSRKTAGAAQNSSALNQPARKQAVSPARQAGSLAKAATHNQHYQNPLKVTLLAYTPEPEKVVAAAARLCYSPQSGADLMDNLDEGKTQEFLGRLSAQGHFSPFEHATFTFAVDGVSRSLSHQLVRHRIASYSQKSQRYVKEQGFQYVIPPAIAGKPEQMEAFQILMAQIEAQYSAFLAAGIPAEDARSVLPNATATNLVITMNARSLHNFFRLRCCRRAQAEIRKLANLMLAKVKQAAPSLFMDAGPSCLTEGVCYEGKMSCGMVNVPVRKGRA